ncbi:PPC domain-containing protein [Pseudomonas sp. CGJS7]|uniref:PPC domain-containing protein n=1 Tax=Pseudomonas sp. CGJS7 TaxID=3109348 RepID=UPI0030091216
MRMETGKMRWAFSAMIAATAWLSGTAAAAALTAPYALHGLDLNQDPIYLARGAGDGLLVAGSRYDTQNTQVQRFDSAGQSLGPAQWLAGRWNDIASDGTGNYVVATSGDQGVWATLFNRNGGVAVPTFQVHTAAHLGVHAAMNEAGAFVLVYTRSVPDANGTPIYTTLARTFNRDGTSRSNAIQVAHGDNYANYGATGVSIDAAGNFSVVMIHVGGNKIQIRVNRYNGTGLLLNSYDQVNDTGSANEAGVDGASLAGNAAGEHMVGWRAFDMPTGTAYVRAQRFGANGQKVGTPMLLDNDPAGSVGNGRYQAKVGVADDGRFVAAWAARTSALDANAPWGVFAREYAADGTPMGAVFRVDSAAESIPVNMYSVEVMMSPSGQYTVAWRSDRQMARRYNMEGGPQVTELSNGVAVGGLSGAANTFRYFRFSLAPNTPNFRLTMTGAGDADMVVRYGAPPTLSSYDFSTGVDGSNEVAQIGSPPAGDFYVGVFGYTSYSNVSLKADW